MSDEQPDTGTADSADRIRFEVRNQVAWLTIDSPDRGNALTPAMRDRLGGLLRGLNGRFEARAAVITAVGDRHFCTGADLSAPRPPAPRPEGAPQPAVGEARRMMLDGQLTLMPSVLDCEIPVVAAVNGTAAGIGAHLALCCDLVLMAPRRHCAWASATASCPATTCWTPPPSGLSDWRRVPPGRSC